MRTYLRKAFTRVRIHIYVRCVAYSLGADSSSFSASVVQFLGCFVGTTISYRTCQLVHVRTFDSRQPFFHVDITLLLVAKLIRPMIISSFVSGTSIQALNLTRANYATKRCTYVYVYVHIHIRVAYKVRNLRYFHAGSNLRVRVLYAERVRK